MERNFIMTKNTNMSDVIAEVKNASEDELREVINKWFEHARTAGMKIGAAYISAAVYEAIKKNIKTRHIKNGCISEPTPKS